MNYVIVRDYVVFEGSYENEQDARDLLKYYEKNYLGNFSLVLMTNKDFNKWLHGMMTIFECIEKARAYGLFTR
jgi:hypothetical protein